MAGAAMIAGALVGMPARADSPEVFFGSAAGKALDLNVLGTEAAFGATEASADSTGAATASGAGALLPGVDVPSARDLTIVGGQSADASQGDPDVKSKRCKSDTATAALPSNVKQLVNLGIVCSAAEARKSGGPSAKAEASLAEVGLNAQFAVDHLDAALGDKGAELLGDICETIAGLKTETDTQPAKDQAAAACSAKDTLADVVANVLKTSTVLDAAVGKTTSSVTTEASKVTSTATAAGATVEILPLPEVGGLSSDPLATLAISQASATAVYDRGTGAATASFDPALVRIKLNPAVARTLTVENEFVVTAKTLLDGVTVPVETGVPPTDKTVGGTTVPFPETLVCDDDPSSICLDVDPLEVRIRVGNGRVVTNADGSVKAVADGVSVTVTLKPDLPVDPGVPETLASLAIAHAEAAAGGQAAKVTKSNDDGDNGGGPGNAGPPELSRTLPPAELPRTGGTPWIPLVGATALSLAVIGRRVAAKATR